MSGFSPSTYSLLYKKIKSVATGVKSVNADPTNPNNIIFTLHDNSKITITLSNPITFVNKYSSLSTTGKDKYLYVCKEDDGDNKKGIYIWNTTDSKYESLTGNGKGINIVNDYSKLKTSLTDYEIDYCLNDYVDTSVTPNKTYDKGFYLYDKTTNKWNPISVTGKIASNTTLGNVIIKKDGGIEVDNNGNIWIGGYTKTETIDPITGDKTTTIDFNGVKTTTTETPSGDISEKTVVGDVPISTNTKTDPTTGDITTTTTIGGTITTTVTSTDSSTGNITTSTVKKDSVTGGTTKVIEKVDSTGNPISSSVVNKDKDGNEINSITTTVTNKTDPVSGDSITETVVENTNSSGISKIDTTTKNNTTGTTSTDTTYDAPQDMFMDRNESDKLMENIFDDFGW